MSKMAEVIGKNFELKSTTKRISGVPVKIKNYIDVDTFSSIVWMVALSCFVEDEKKEKPNPRLGEYHAENREIARRYSILKYMTDIDLGDADVSEVFNFTQGAWFAQIESEVTKLPLWGEVETAIDKQIDYFIITRQTPFDKVCEDVSAILSNDNSQNLADIKDVLDKLGKVDKQKFIEAATEDAIKKTKSSSESGVKKTSKK